MSEHASSRCDQCGKVDADPKSHWNSGETYHHDCLPYDKKAILRDADSGGEHGAAIIDAAENGLRGEELRAHIVSLHGGAN